MDTKEMENEEIDEVLDEDYINIATGEMAELSVWISRYEQLFGWISETNNRGFPVWANEHLEE